MDTPAGWTNKWGDDCATYGSRGWCESNGTNVGTDGVAAETACCACGGGSTVLVCLPDVSDLVAT